MSDDSRKVPQNQDDLSTANADSIRSEGNDRDQLAQSRDPIEATTTAKGQVAHSEQQVNRIQGGRGSGPTEETVNSGATQTPHRSSTPRRGTGTSGQDDEPSGLQQDQEEARNLEGNARRRLEVHEEGLNSEARKRREHEEQQRLEQEERERDLLKRQRQKIELDSARNKEVERRKQQARQQHGEQQRIRKSAQEQPETDQTQSSEEPDDGRGGEEAGRGGRPGPFESPIQEQAPQQPPGVPTPPFLEFLRVLIGRVRNEVHLCRRNTFKPHPHIIYPANPTSTRLRRSPVWELEGHLVILQNEYALYQEVGRKFNPTREDMLVRNYIEYRLKNDLCGHLVFDLRRLAGSAIRARAYRITARAHRHNGAEKPKNSWSLDCRTTALGNVNLLGEEGQIDVIPDTIVTIQVDELSRAIYTPGSTKLVYTFGVSWLQLLPTIEFQLVSTGSTVIMSLTSVWRPTQYNDFF